MSIVIQAAARLAASREAELGKNYVEWLGFKVLPTVHGDPLVRRGHLSFRVDTVDPDVAVDKVTSLLKVQPKKYEDRDMTEWTWKLSDTQQVLLTTYMQLFGTERLWRVTILDKGESAVSPGSSGYRTKAPVPRNVKYR